MMNEYIYTSILKKEFSDFFKLRHSQGFKDKNRYIWNSFDAYLTKLPLEKKCITADIVEGWIASNCQNLRGGSIEGYITSYNAFARYLNSINILAYLQPHALNLRDHLYIPYVFSHDEINEIFRLADEGKSSKDKLSKLQFPMFIRLLYGCGLRLSEALNLKINDVNLVEGTLLITHGKGNKDRIVPMDWGVVLILQKYCKAIQRKIPEGVFLFESNYKDGKNCCIGHPRSQSWARSNFSNLLKFAGISSYTARNERGICPHCLRHTFVDHTLIKQNANGINSYEALPIISVYLGHEDLTETQKYIHLTSEASNLIVQKSAYAYQNLFPEVPQ